MKQSSNEGKKRMENNNLHDENDVYKHICQLQVI